MDGERAGIGVEEGVEVTGAVFSGDEDFAANGTLGSASRTCLSSGTQPFQGSSTVKEMTSFCLPETRMS